MSLIREITLQRWEWKSTGKAQSAGAGNGDRTRGLQFGKLTLYH
jgi:hypothetical protein